MKTVLRDMVWILPASLGLGAVLSALSGGRWVSGWLAFTLLLLLGFSALASLWRNEKGIHAGMLGVVILVAFLVRLGLGMTLSFILPAFGANNPTDQAGYVFRDAYNRDLQAWNLAGSSDPIWKAFDKSYSTDQYGGLLAFSALVYRVLSPDAHRPWLIILLAALAAAAGIAFAWRTARKLTDEPTALLVCWILALYPESVFLGASQMREPFLITFGIMFMAGILELSSGSAFSWIWVGVSLLGMLLVSPGMAVFALIGMGIWFWLKSGKWRIPWRALLIGSLVLLTALALLWLGLSVGWLAGASPLRTFSTWLQWSAKWDAFLMEQNSGWLQQVLKQLPDSLRMPFVTGYGLTQPLLPAAVFDRTVWPWTLINIILASGWYLLAPFLAISLFTNLKKPVDREQRAWIWLWVITWIWIILSSYRAGGDQWDNPRYRSWFLIWQTLLAAKTFAWWRRSHNPWMVRVLAVEGIFLVFLGIWYSSRYGTWANRPLHIFTVIAAVLLAGLLILGWGWIRDTFRNRHRKRA